MNNNLINRQDAIDALEEQLDYLRMLDKNENPTAEGKWYGVNWARNTIADLPSAEIPQGEWIFHNDYHENCKYGCNQCGNLTNIPGNFCPNCGIKMKVTKIAKGGEE